MSCQSNHQYYKARLNICFQMNLVKRGLLCHPCKGYNRPRCNDKQLAFGVDCALMGSVVPLLLKVSDWDTAQIWNPHFQEGGCPKWQNTDWQPFSWHLIGLNWEEKVEQPTPQRNKPVAAAAQIFFRKSGRSIEINEGTIDPATGSIVT